MGDARKPTALDDQDKKLDPQNFAYISDDTYTVEEVEAQTQVGAASSGGGAALAACAAWLRPAAVGSVIGSRHASAWGTAADAARHRALLQVIVGLVPERLKKAPNTKMFLRSFWYRATLKEVVLADEMHIYTLARWV